MKIKFTCAFFLIVFTLSSLFATNHIITFGNYYYSPANTTVMVGDTVTWMGDFGAHPLSTTAIPSGATPIISWNIGTTYSYRVLMAGSYSYQCDLHFSQGMTGTFTASPVASVEEVVSRPTLNFRLSTFGGVVKVNDQSDMKGNNYEVRIRNILGKQVYAGTMNSDEQEKLIDIQDQPQGVYLLNITDENRQTFVRKFLIQ
jgi:plastocyanin